MGVFKSSYLHSSEPRLQLIKWHYMLHDLEQLAGYVQIRPVYTISRAPFKTERQRA